MRITYSMDAAYEEDVNGFLRVPARVMKVGLLKYLDPNKIPYTGFISRDELEKAVKTAGLKPITNRHPEDMITPYDYKKHTVGTSGENFRIEEKDGEQWLVGDFAIQSKDEIDLIKKAKAEGKPIYVSSGYYRKPVRTGDFSFDFTDIKFNHFAIGVAVPRAGGASLDSLDDEVSNKGETQTLNKKVHMKYVLPKVVIGGFSQDEATIDYNEDSQAAIEKMRLREDQIVKEATRAIAAGKKSLDDATGTIQGLEARLKEAEEKLANSYSMDELEARVQGLTEVKSRAAKLGLPTDFKTEAAGKKAILEAVYGKSFDDALVDGAYSTLPADDKDTMERIKAKSALANVNKSMDSMNVFKRVSHLSVNEIKAQMKRGA